MIFKIRYTETITKDAVVELTNVDVEVDDWTNLAELPPSIILNCGDKIAEVVVEEAIYFELISPIGGNDEI